MKWEKELMDVIVKFLNNQFKSVFEIDYDKKSDLRKVKEYLNKLDRES